MNQEEAEDGTGRVEEASHSPSTSELDTQDADEHSKQLESDEIDRKVADPIQSSNCQDPRTDLKSLDPHPSEAPRSDLPQLEGLPLQSEAPPTDLPQSDGLPLQSEAPPTDLPQSEGLPLQSEAPPSDLLQSEGLSQQSEGLPTDLQLSEARPKDLPLESQPTDLPQSEAPPTNLPQSEALPTNLPQSEAPPTNLPQSEAPPTNLPQSEAPATNLSQSEAPATNLPQSEAPPTNLPSSEGPPINSRQSEGRPTDVQQSKGLPTDMLSSKISGRLDKIGEDNYRGDTQMNKVEDHTTSKSDDIKESTVGSPQLTHHTSSPLNSVSLEGEVTLLKKTGEIKTARKEELKSTLLKSAGIQLQQGSQHSTQEYTTPQQNSNVGVSVLPEQPPTRQDKPMSIPLTKYDSPSLDDRNLEQFSEILLDSDFSPSDSELEPSGPKQKAEKRVRFADEVEALWKGGATASGWSVLSYFPLQI